MNQFFYSLLYTPKVRRWMQILDMLEDQEHTTALSLANLTQCSKRTIHTDIKEIKHYFDGTIVMKGDDHGSHFSLQAPKEYYQKKQALIHHEPIFLLFDRIIEEKKATNHQLAQDLDIPLATFNRLKRYCAKILHSNYRLRIDATTNVLIGPETAIRQFLFDFYCTCPLYPKALEEKVAQFRTTPLVFRENRWKLDSILASQWTAIVKERISRGHLLSDEGTDHSMQSLLVREWRQGVDDPLPEREQAALFVLSLDESAFFNPRYQRAFLQYFSPLVIKGSITEESEPVPVALFEVLILFLKLFFQLPQEVLHESEKRDQAPDAYLLQHLILRYKEERKRLSQTVSLTYDLIGSNALKRWLKQEVYNYLSSINVEMIETRSHRSQPYIRHLTITNKPLNHTDHHTVVLPLVPSGQGIGEYLAKVLKQQK